MCDYCKNYYTGNDWKPIESKEIKGGIFGNLEIYATIEEHKGTPCLAVGIDLLDFPDDKTVQGYKKIRFCPMCGKNLIEGG